MNRLLLSTLAAALFCGSASAAGTFSQTASYRDVQLNVIDLTPNDGAAASYTVNSVSTFYYQWIDQATIDGRETSVWQFEDGQAQSAHQTAYEDATTSGSFTGTIGQIGAAASAGYGIGPRGSASSSIEQTVRLTLSAHSVLTLSGAFDYSSVVTPGATALNGGADMTVTFASDNVRWYNGGEDVLDIRGGSGSVPFWYSIANLGNTATDVTLILTANTGASIWQDVSPVPEPSTYAMLLAGLGVAGWAARRRRG